MTQFNEDSRVKIPTIIHLMKLGYDYLSLKEHKWDIDSNIFTDIFMSSIQQINPTVSADNIKRYLTDIKLLLDNDDLGKAFYEKLLDQSNIKLIDLENFDNNTFNVVTELTCKNGDDEFRPDITLLINGLPLVFIEVKKPNNREGVIAERTRIDVRSQNSKFKRFINITQFMIYSNNMEYDDEDIEPIQGAYYASPSYHKNMFNYFREEENYDELNSRVINSPSVADENNVLMDNNLISIASSPEFLTNKSPTKPTNRICTSLLSRERLAFILRYAITYVKDKDEFQKHIMRYPQMFAIKAIGNKLNEGIKKGIIWHTQGSGKTALAYYSVGYLTDFYQKQNIIPKFYFIVDRISLLEQAKIEFTSRGLKVIIVNSRDEFAKNIKETKAIQNSEGIAEITVVNIQKFKDDSDVIKYNDYNINIQRIYFLDEVHRSYNPNGSFLANLEQSDKNAIKIGLTGTPLIGTDRKSKDLFGDYIHKYYYNASIADGYTLRLIREAISTEYQLQLRKVLEELEVQKGSLKTVEALAKTQFVRPMLEYIVTDLEQSRATFDDPTMGAMVICSSSDQAKEMHRLFIEQYDREHNPHILNDLPQHQQSHQQKNKVTTSTLILHDVGSKEERKEWVGEYKAGKTDILFVYNMLLTGFDAPRLKKLYMGRVIRDHGLLQALTRVNRTYKDFRFGYVVDFADIESEFKKTNEAYFEELQLELGDEIEHYSNLFKTHEEILQEVDCIQDALFGFNIGNAEVFSEQISEIADKKQMLAIKKALATARNLYNTIRFQGDVEFINELDFGKLKLLLRETSNHIDLLNLKDTVENSSNNSNLLNQALENILFKFTKIGESELVLADELKTTLRKTRESLAENFDPKDPEFITLKEELERLFKQRKLSEVSQEEMQENIKSLDEIMDKAKKLNQENERIKQMFNGDGKYLRVHKRLREREQSKHDIHLSERKIAEFLISTKHDVDETVYNSNDILNNEAFFAKSSMRIIRSKYREQNTQNLPTAELSKYISNLVVSEYQNEFNTGSR